MAEESGSATETTETKRAGRPRSPLIIGAIAYAILLWMFLVVCLLIAWRLTTQ
jgi:hypothetical protein